MTDDAREISSLSQKDLELIERIEQKHAAETAFVLHRMYKRGLDRIEERFDELEEKLEAEED